MMVIFPIKRVWKFMPGFVAVIFLLPAIAGAEPLLFLPTAERMYGEALFASAYQKALDGKVSIALEELEEALRYDPYLVSYYLLKGYCLSLLGNYTEASRNLELYLEVKADDPFATGFLKEVNERKAYIEESLSSGISSQAEIKDSGLFRDRFCMDILWRPHLTMPGRPSLLGNILAFSDNAMEKVWVYRKDEQSWKKYYSGQVEGEIVRVLPIGGDELVLIFSDGTFLRGIFSRRTFSETFRGKTEARSISDATFAGAQLMALAERVMGRVQVVNISNGKILSSWQPDQSVFEPVSLATLGPLLAVADRSGKRVFILNIPEMEEIGNFSISGHPRSVEWLNSRKIVVLTEEGTLFDISLKDGQVINLGRTFPEAWFLFRNGKGDVFVTDTRLFRYSNISIRTERGFLALKYPSHITNGSAGRNHWTVEARLIQPLGASRLDKRIFQGILGGSLTEVVDTEITSRKELLELETLPEPSKEEFTRGAAKHLLLKPEEIPSDLPSITSFAGYALSNGTVVHLLADKEIPSLYLLRLSEATGGRMILSRDQIRELRACLSCNLQIALGPTLELPGNPKASGLFITGRTGSMVLEGRIPFWNGFLPFPR